MSPAKISITPNSYVACINAGKSLKDGINHLIRELDGISNSLTPLPVEKGASPDASLEDIGMIESMSILINECVLGINIVKSRIYSISTLFVDDREHPKSNKPEDAPVMPKVQEQLYEFNCIGSSMVEIVQSIIIISDSIGSDSSGITMGEQKKDDNVAKPPSGMIPDMYREIHRSINQVDVAMNILLTIKRVLMGDENG